MSDSSAGQIAGGVVGGVVGFIAGGPVGAVQGFSVGYGIGGYVDPPDGPLISAPRLDDLSFQSSSYGKEIPTIYGSIALHGNIIYLENGKYKTVVSREEQDGKGGGGGATVETVEYFATFAVALSEAVQGASIGKLWLGGKLFYNNTDGQSEVGTIIQSSKNGGFFKFYDGTQTQPDDRIESVLGVDNAESYEGTAYIVFYDLPLSEYGNGLQGCPVKVQLGIGSQPALIDSSDKNPSGAVTYSIPQFFGERSYGHYVDNADVSQPDVTVQKLIKNSSGVWVESFKTIDKADYIPPLGLNDGGVVYDSMADALGASYSVISSYCRDGYQIRGNTKSQKGQWCGFASNGEGYASSTGATITSQQSTQACGISPDGENLYFVSGGSIKLFDSSLNFITSISHGQTVNKESCSLWVDGSELWFGVRSESAGGIEGAAINKFFILPLDLSFISLKFQISNVGTQSDTHSLSYFTVSDGVLYRAAMIKQPDNKIIYERWQVSPALSSFVALEGVVSSIVSKSGVSANDVDTSQLSGDLVRGYITNPSSARGSLSQLQAVYLFDIVQTGYSLTAVKRGASEKAVIPYGDLGAKTAADAPAVRLSQSREMDTQLPSRVEISYFDANREYDTGTQYADSPTKSDNKKSIELAIAMTPNEAAKVADILIGLSWIERSAFSFSLPQKYLWLKVSDVVLIETPERDYQVRVDSINYSKNQTLQVIGKLSSPSIYVSDAVGSEGVIPDPNVNLITASESQLIDSPMIINSLDFAGFAACMYSEDGWRGGSLFRSIDDGQTYTNLQSFTGGAVVGRCTNSLTKNNGFVVDRVESLNLYQLSGQFTSITEQQMMLGKNWCAYGRDGVWELIRYANAITEVNGSVTLSTLIRGARGTEWATDQHNDDDIVILLDSSNNQFIGANIERIGVDSLYKSVTFSASVADSQGDNFTYRGVNLRPLSPVLPVVSKSADILITCTSRTRYQGSFWLSGVQPQNESALLYELDILDGGSIIRTITNTSPDFTYTLSEQIEDFGAGQDEIKANCYQVSDRVGRGLPLFIESTAQLLAARYWRMDISQNQTGSGFTVCPEMAFLDENSNDITTTGTAIASSEINSLNGPALAFDGDPTTQWASASADTSPYLGFIFNNAVKVASIAWQGWYFSGQSGAAMLGGQIQYSNDGISWQDIGEPITAETGWSAFEVRTFVAQ
tara:strand:+ start:1626 stop:5207 length:3582 start_codon:yes stop_codon:yes gene_type:complete